MPEIKNDNMKGQIKIAGIIVVIAIAFMIVISFINGDDSGGIATGETPLFKVEAGPLTISVTESGTIKAQEQVILKSEIEGRSTILYLIPEATRVKKGDRLVELDATSLRDQLIKQDIDVLNANAAYIKAREDLDIGKSQAQSDIEKAELAYEFSKQDLDKYIKGEYPNLLKEAQVKIKLNREEETRASFKYDGTKQLAADKYVSETELMTDKLTWDKAKLNYELAVSDLELLENYTYKRQMAQLQSDVKQSKMELDRTRKKAKGDLAQAEAKLVAAESVLEREKTILKKTEQQISKAIILAPSDGLVVYATSTKASWHRSQEPLDVGQEVHEYEELIHLPTADSVKSEISIHESNLSKVKEGLPANITVDALPGKVFYGTVNKIAVMPNAQMVFINPDLKVYTTDVFIDGNSKELRTGMSCKTEIIVQEHENVMFVPVQAVVRIGNQPTVYVMDGNKMKPRSIEIGLDNNRMVHVISGLEDGDKVVLTPPLKNTELKRTGAKRPGQGPPAGKKPEGMKRPGGKP